jgi:hypothetical protein
MNTCVICDAPTDEAVTGHIGDKHGVMCADCQHWCDGNLDQRPGLALPSLV